MWEVRDGEIGCGEPVVGGCRCMTGSGGESCGEGKCVSEVRKEGESGGWGRSHSSRLPWGGALGGTGCGRVCPKAARGEAHVASWTVVTWAPPPVEVPAHLFGMGRCSVSGASRGDPGFLGWPAGGKKRALGRRVGGGEEVVTPCSGASLPRPGEGFGVKLRVDLTP